MASPNDISIGENSWITWVEFDSRDNHAILEIDNLLEPTFDFWAGLETNCIIACCGIDALSFLADDIIRASSNVDQAQLINNLEKIKSEIIKSDKTIVLSGKLNNLLDKGVFIKLIDHILITISEAS